MTRRHSLNQLLVLICLTGILGIATHALLMIHLACCHRTETVCGDHDHGHGHKEHPAPAHDHDNCGLCQMFLGASGKYISQAVDSCCVIDTNVSCSIVFVPQLFTQHTLSRAIPRGPPLT